MNKKYLVIFLVVVAFLSIGTIIGVFSYSRSQYTSKINEAVLKQKEVKAETDKIKEDQDENKYLPTDTVKFFMNEVKSGSAELAKLYLAIDSQSLNIANALALEKEAALINFKDSSYEITDEVADVKYTFSYGDEEVNYVRNFVVVKEESAWKIKEIKGE